MSGSCVTASAAQWSWVPAFFACRELSPARSGGFGHCSSSHCEDVRSGMKRREAGNSRNNPGSGVIQYQLCVGRDGQALRRSRDTKVPE